MVFTTSARAAAPERRFAQFQQGRPGRFGERERGGAFAGA
jgi:hypothetical protein